MNFLKKIKNKKNKQLYIDQSAKDAIALKKQNIKSDLPKTIKTFKTIYTYPENSDVQFRQIQIGGLNKKAYLLLINTITNLDLIDEQIISPLLQNEDASKKVEAIISMESITTKTTIKDIVTDVNKGNAALFVDGETECYIINASKFEGRSVEKPENEVVIKGPKEAFIEKAATNISLLRKKIKSENLVVEASTISERSQNELYILYIHDLTDKELLKNVRKRVNALDVDAVQNLSLLEQHIEEKSTSIFPTILYTERPDRAASFLEDGYIVLLMDNSPASLILPATFWSFFHSPEDHYLRLPYGNFTRGLRAVALFITLFTSAIYVSVTSFHADMIPPDLLLAIASTREKVPFPAIVEVLLMEMAFELIREAGLRVPSPIGPTIGIVGALILGQAAVQANIVSPIVVIVVALSGLSSFTFGDISMNYTIRLSRFFFIGAAGLFGIYGMAALFTMGMFYMVSIKSFGVPYLSPMTPRYLSSGDTIFRRLLKNEIFRPSYLKQKDIEKKQGE